MIIGEAGDGAHRRPAEGALPPKRGGGGGGGGDISRAPLPQSGDFFSKGLIMMCILYTSTVENNYYRERPIVARLYHLRSALYSTLYVAMWVIKCHNTTSTFFPPGVLLSINSSFRYLTSQSSKALPRPNRLSNSVIVHCHLYYSVLSELLKCHHVTAL